MRVEVTEKRFVKMNIRVRDRNATTLIPAGARPRGVRVRYRRRSAYGCSPYP